LLESLEKGFLTTTKGNQLTDKEKLNKTIYSLRTKLKKVESEIIEILESDIYITIISIKNWQDYFQKTKEKLNQELEELQLLNKEE